MYWWRKAKHVYPKTQRLCRTAWRAVLAASTMLFLAGRAFVGGSQPVPLPRSAVHLARQNNLLVKCGDHTSPHLHPASMTA
jgi:hypothetical protein